jgi:GNAT superfamily N-acetyltransferase
MVQHSSLDKPGHAATTPVKINRCTGAALAPLIPELAALRIRVFRDWPFLYDGDPDYEAKYLRTYVQSPRAAVIVASQDAAVVGASTCIPLTDETPDIQAPFLAKGWDPARFFYFGESVLLPDLRGQGIGVAFFNEREAHARAVSTCDFACFCGVIRADEHPLRPAGFQKLDPFWQRRGYSRRPDLTCSLSWRDIGEPAPTAKTLGFWMKSLHGAPLP